MLEVVKPAAQRGIQIGYDTGQAVPTRAPSLVPYPLPQRQQTFPPHPAPPNFEAIAQKLKALPGLQTISHVGLVKVSLSPFWSTQALTSSSAARASSAVRHST